MRTRMDTKTNLNVTRDVDWFTSAAPATSPVAGMMGLVGAVVAAALV